LITHFIPHSVA